MFTSPSFGRDGIMPRSCQSKCIRAAFVTGEGMQVVRLRQVVRPRLLHDWTELLKQFPACSQMGGVFIPSSQGGSQPVWGLLHDWAVLVGPGDNEAIIGLQPDG